MDDLDLDGLPENGGLMDGIIPPTLQAAANAAQNVVGKITMVSVMSSDIAAWGYDPINFKLQIQFTNSRMYLYENISPLEFEALMTSPSKGKAFWGLIRRNPVGHPFTRLA